MKKLIPITAGIMTLFAANAQMTITHNGKKITELECDMKNVHLSFVLPSNYKSYEKIDVSMKKTAPENDASDPNLYGVVWSSGYFDGKKTIEVDLVNKDGGSDFFRGLLELEFSDPCYDPMRTYTYLEDIFYINGAVHNGWDYENGKKVKTYTWETIKQYKVKHNIGPVLDHYYGPSQKFTFDKLKGEDLDVELVNYSGVRMLGTIKEPRKGASNNAFDMSGAAPKATSGEIKLVSEIIDANEYSLEDCIKGVEFNLVRTSNKSFVINGFNIPFDHQSFTAINHTYHPITPEGATSGGGSTQEESNSGGKLGKLKNFTKQFTTAQKGGKLTKSENKELVNKIAQNSGDYFNWTDAKLGNLAVKKLEIDVYDSDQVLTNDAWATYIKDGEEGKTRKLLVYIGQQGDDIICLAVYKYEFEGLTATEEKIISNIEKTFKAL